MMNDQQPTNFFDKNTMLAVLLSFAVFFGWQQYMLKKYPPQDLGSAQTSSPTEETTESPKGPAPLQDPSVPPAPAELSATTALASAHSYKSKTLNFEVSNQGFAVFGLQLNDYKRRNGDPILYERPIQFLKVGDQSKFAIQKVNENQFIGSATTEQQKVEIKYTVYPDQYQIKVNVVVENAQKQKVTLLSQSEYEVLPVESSFLLPPTDYQEFFFSSTAGIQREKVSPDVQTKLEVQQAKLAAFNSQYFAQAFMNHSDLMPKVSAQVSNAQAQLQWLYETVEPVDRFATEYSIYLGPKKEEVLVRIDDSLVDMIDYGIFGFIGRPMHTALVAIHKLVGNWGLAIILITLILRTLILPAGVYSFRSMKKMQKIQPKLQAIKEKYKNDAQKANQETLLLLRAEKANPLSGCIPALLQLPIFIAFFTMMSSSFELYMQPFFLWIHDLSSKDPYYVFPTLAGAAMYFQMKMTPTTTTDPAQAKIMAFMPLLFTVFMLSTPSGLALYMFIGSIFSIFQQLLFMKEKTT